MESDLRLRPESPDAGRVSPRRSARSLGTESARRPPAASWHSRCPGALSARRRTAFDRRPNRRWRLAPWRPFFHLDTGASRRCTGGGERLADLDLLLQRIKEHDLPQEAFEWYLDLRRYGTVPHGGFGMGIERVVAWICKLEHVRETIPYPRMLYRIYP